MLLLLLSSKEMLTQVPLAFLVTLTLAEAVPPRRHEGGAVEKTDENPPKYEYRYNVQNDKGTGQGKLEARDGIFASGRYYVQGKNSSQNVEYVADDWGYHPYVEYSNVGPHSQTITQIALDTKSLNTLRNKKNKLDVPDSLEVPNTKTEHSPESQTEPNEDVDVVLQKQELRLLTVKEDNGSHIIPVDQNSAELPQNNAIDYRQQSDSASENPLQLLQQQIALDVINDNQNQQQQLVSAPLLQQGLVFIDQVQQPNYQEAQGNYVLQPFIYQVPIPLNYQQPPEITQHDTLQFETAALYENAANNVNYEPLTKNLDHYGGYGSKINVKVTHNSQPVKLAQHVKNLVNGQDVLDINQAVGQNLDEAVAEGTTAIVSEYGSLERPNSQSMEEDSALSKQPIVVADIDYQNTIESSTLYQSQSSTIVVTPRPLSSNFLAPITAGVQLTAAESDEKSAQAAHENFEVDVQKSIPYYLGKVIYIDGTIAPNADNANYTTQHIAIGGFLNEPANDTPIAEALVAPAVDSENSGTTFSQALSVSDDRTPKTVEITKIIERPVEVTRYVDKPYPVHVPVEVPVTVEKRVPVPVAIEKIVEKPVMITKIIEKPIHISHTVERKVPVPITKYVDRPYPVAVPVAKPVPYPVQVEKIVEKIVNQPYPVEVRVPVQVPITIEKKVPYPQYIEKQVPVEKIVEKPVPQYIHRPYPVPIRVPVPVAQAFYVPVAVPKPYPVEVTKYVNKPYPVPKPYPVHVTQTIEVPVAQPVPIEVRVPHPVPVEVPKIINNVVERPYPIFFKNEASVKVPRYYPNRINNQRTPCLDLRSLGIQKPYCHTNNNIYIGLVPPKEPLNHHHHNNTATVRKQRIARQNFEQNIRLEYGFMPPLIPSLAIDENGNPVDKHTK